MPWVPFKARGVGSFSRFMFQHSLHFWNTSDLLCARYTKTSDGNRGLMSLSQTDRESERLDMLGSFPRTFLMLIHIDAAGVLLLGAITALRRRRRPLSCRLPSCSLRPVVPETSRPGRLCERKPALVLVFLALVARCSPLAF